MPFDFERAQRVARAWFEASHQNGGIALNDGVVVTRPYGWVFFGRHVLDLEVTGMPTLLFDRVNGDMVVVGSGTPLEIALAQYEAAIPPARLEMAPELPPGGDSVFDTGMITIRAHEPIRPDGFPPSLRAYWDAYCSKG